MSDTPRTDAIYAAPNRPSPAQLKPIMQQLERELAAATERAEFLARELSTLKLDFEDKQRRLGRKTVLQWIPVGDMLPETMTDVLILVRVSEGAERIYAGCRYSDHWHTESEAIIHPKVLAWCPWPTAPTL